MAKPPQFVTAKNGVRVAVVLDMEEYEKLLAELEDCPAIREYEVAKAAGELPIPLEQAWPKFVVLASEP
jgi:hypothetical protein